MTDPKEAREIDVEKWIDHKIELWDNHALVSEAAFRAVVKGAFLELAARVRAETEAVERDRSKPLVEFIEAIKTAMTDRWPNLVKGAKTILAAYDAGEKR